MKKESKFFSVKTVRTILSTLTSCVLLAGMALMPVVSLQASEAIKITCNSQMVNGINPILKNGSVLVPLKSVSQLLGGEVAWHASEKKIQIARGNVINELYIGKTTAYKYEGDKKVEVQLSVPAVVENGSTYVPLRYISESLETEVAWDQAKHTVILKEGLGYKGKKIYLGGMVDEALSTLGEPSYRLADENYAYLFYVEDYLETLVLQVKGDKVCGFSSSAQSMQFRDFYYSVVKQSNDDNLVLVADHHDGDKVVAMGYGLDVEAIKTVASISVNERIIFELTNGFRAYQGVEALGYNSDLSNVARAHSADMAKNNYFSHDSLSGLKVSDRISNGGINWQSCGENIAAGRGAGIVNYGLWLNSLGHRMNMLEQKGDLGVGGVYDPTSEYDYYYTQNFAKVRK